MQQFSLSANIEEGMGENAHYIVTPNVRSVASGLAAGYQSGIHSFTLIGSYGTGKSSFLLALEKDFLGEKSAYGLVNPQVFSATSKWEVVKIVGDYKSMSSLLCGKLSVDGTSDNVLDSLRDLYAKCRKQGKFLVILVDEFGKVLEYAAKNNPERELYFMQKLAEFVNVPTRNILFVATLHQNFSAYARNLSDVQKEEWTKVKGRFKELVFIEPVEQLLYLASAQMHKEGNKRPVDGESLNELCRLAKATGYVSEKFSENTAYMLYPLEPFSAYVITQAIQRYGQNERSLFTFLNARGVNSLAEFSDGFYGLANCYNYILHNFYSYLKDANADSMQWSSMQVALERVEGQAWETKDELLGAMKIVKTIGLLNLLGNASFKMTREQTAKYAEVALDVNGALHILKLLEQYKIIRYASYKLRYILFDGTDINIEDEIRKAGLQVPRPVNYVDEIRSYCLKKIAPVKMCYFQKGTPRYFEYEILEEGQDRVPTGDTDGYIQLVFSADSSVVEKTLKKSSECKNAIIFACFKNTVELVDHLYMIEKYNYVLSKVLVDKSDHVAINEINNLLDYEKVLLNKSLNDALFSYNDDVVWIFGGEEVEVRTFRMFNELLSHVCETVYPLTPIMNNELFNRHKLSGSISSARVKYFSAMLNNGNQSDFGFAADKFPPEKTIYYSLLKSTGLHVDGEFKSRPASDGIMTLWKACEDFLASTTGKSRKISELIKILSSRPYKLKQGFLDFWIPTYLYIRKQEYSLYGTGGAYIPNVNMEFFELLQKHPADYSIKALDVTGIRMDIFNQYRKFLNVKALGDVKSNDFVETIKPFFFFYSRQLNDYAKHTRKFNHEQTARFRDVLAVAKDPEKTFFEDLPEALGFDKESLHDKDKVEEFCYVVNRAVRELRSCYNNLIDRIESSILDALGIEPCEYAEYIQTIRNRFASVKEHLLTDRLKEFYHHVMTEFDNRKEWYQSICYTALEQPLERLRDENEEKLIHNLITLFHECEKYSDISKMSESGDEAEEYFSVNMMATKGRNISAQTYRLPQSEQSKSDKLEKLMDKVLEEADNDNVAICTLLRMLNKKIAK